jgi:aspartyl-tRNA synthetase
MLDAAAQVPQESVVLVEGAVHARPDDQRNPDLGTGDVEVRATRVTVAGPVLTDGLPIPVWRAKGEPLPAEESRLRYRYLDLRRPEFQRNFVLRHRLMQRGRRTLSELGFLEIETPILTKPTPEGARDYLVPSRVHPGHCYALPQSPQIYKQLLMIAGFDRYFQIARCFRDEDLRADRQPEFTQIDLEMSFAAPDDVYAVMERVMVALWEESGASITGPFARMAYRDALERYGTDKPDARFGLEIVDLTGMVRGRGFKAFDEGLGAGHRVRGIRVPAGAALSRKDVDGLTTVARGAGLGGLATVKRKGDELTGPLARLEGASVALFELEDGDLLLAAGGADDRTSAGLGAVRRRLIELLSPAPSVSHAFLWVEHFPLFEPDPDGRWVFAHHPFTAPHPDDRERLLAGDVAEVRALHYDLVYNGHELGSGSIRITDPLVQRRVFDALGMTPGEAERRFGFFLEALTAGAPPHGGFALGMDRTAMLLAGADNLREVIAFPKTTAARALFEDAPAPVDPAELAALGLRRAP